MAVNKILTAEILLLFRFTHGVNCRKKKNLGI
jgi:hypothetical protein